MIGLKYCRVLEEADGTDNRTRYRGIRAIYRDEVLTIEEIVLKIRDSNNGLLNEPVGFAAKSHYGSLSIAARDLEKAQEQSFRRVN
ncbi:hypothetical protein COV15_00720 [Candidatus Woesearchaeota archaeon CG10_big_fil_rev_8_21_14_0_10_34_12]|nr:MAG: hypothetical protein COV15_00720 [Candidatus Woesearchaeota archaeon CG10_big_fil_rev_8_21_14_0_10_34_12]